MTRVPMTAVTPDSLKRFVFDVLRAMGLPDEEAEIFGGALIFSELRFHPGHGQGVKKLRRYWGRFDEGGIDPGAPWEIVKESPALALVDANNGIGTVAATRAMRLAIEKSKVCGIGQVIVRDSTHFGSSAVHACLGPEAGCIGIAMTNAGPEMAPWGGREGVVGTNPWGIAAPTGLGFPAAARDRARARIFRNPPRPDERTMFPSTSSLQTVPLGTADGRARRSRRWIVRASPSAHPERG